MNIYNLKARTYPLIIAIIPIVVVGIIYSINLQNIYQLLISLGITASLFFLMSQIGRDNGKKLEAKMWEKWSGTPTTQILRYSNDSIDKHTKKRYHTFLKDKTKIGEKLNEEFEAENKKEADNIYTSWSKFLISKTRDTTKFNLLFQENINYGFRRNLLGLKPFAITVIITLLLLCYIYSYVASNYILVFSQELIQSTVFLISCLLFWIVIVNNKWVKYVAFEYAKRLMETIENE